MNKIFAAASLTALALVGGAANARGRYSDSGYGYGDDSGPYIGGSVGQFVYQEDGVDTLYPTAFAFRLGVPIAPFLAVEGRIGTGITDSDYTNVDGTDVKVGVDRLAAGYLKGSLPIAPRFSVYGLAGIASTRLRFTSPGLPDGISNDTSFSFGAGGDVQLRGGTTLNFEWARLRSVDTDVDGNATGDMVSVGLVWHF